MFARHIRLFSLRFVFVCSCINMLFLFLCSSSALAHALSTPITVLSQTYTISFPKAIDFQITVRDSISPITQGYIYISSGASRYVSEVHTVVPGHPATLVTLHWHENTSGSPCRIAPAGSDRALRLSVLQSSEDSHCAIGTTGDEFTLCPWAFRSTF